VYRELKDRFLTSFGMTPSLNGVGEKDIQMPVIPNEAKRNEESVKRLKRDKQIYFF